MGGRDADGGVMHLCEDTHAVAADRCTLRVATDLERGGPCVAWSAWPPSRPMHATLDTARERHALIAVTSPPHT